MSRCVVWGVLLLSLSLFVSLSRSLSLSLSLSLVVFAVHSSSRVFRVSLSLSLGFPCLFLYPPHFIYVI